MEEKIKKGQGKEIGDKCFEMDKFWNEKMCKISYKKNLGAKNIMQKGCEIEKLKINVSTQNFKRKTIK